MVHLVFTLRALGIALAIAVPLLSCAPAHPREARPSPASVPVAEQKDRMPDKAGMEAIFDRQGSLMDKALAAVAASRPGKAEFFFVGFAGQASEDVFLNEARAAESLFRRRFGAAGRTLVLANNLKTAGALPVASVPTLERALAGIAAKMGPEDVLFLYITSHGRRGRISVRYGGVNLPDLRVGALRRMLDRINIKNRVVAISACYSGSFIERLRDDYTLIMTAAAADRTSFGCGHDGTYTYFGNALIGEALEKEYSFARAFEIARRSIAARERDEGLKPSLPQIDVGLAIGPVLEQIERDLAARP